MPGTRWKGYIKDYSVSTHMECYINQDINFIRISQILKDQKQLLQDTIRVTMNCEKYEPLPKFD